LFREFDRYIKVLDIYKGVDWTIYVQLRNKEVKDGESASHKFDTECLLDEEEEEK